MYGRRVGKADERVDAYGCVDELNSALGLARALSKDDIACAEVLSVQKELIAVMGELATAPEDLERYRRDGFPLTTSAMVDRLTAVIDKIEASREMKFKDWVLPGGSVDSAAFDLARSTCRRAERRVASLALGTPNFNPQILRYLNRLSDLCWLLARHLEQANPSA